MKNVFRHTQHLQKSGLPNRYQNGYHVRNNVQTAKTVETMEAGYMQEEDNHINAELIHKSTDLEQFSYIISHNLRAPLANIMGVTGILKENATDNDTRLSLLEELATSSGRLDNMIRDINEILHVKCQVNNKKEWVSLSGIVDEVETNIIAAQPSRDFRIICDFSQVKKVFVVKNYLYGIFYNLISNSIKYRRNDEAPEIRIKSRLGNGSISFEFTDNGRGIDLNKAGRDICGLYKRFHREVEGKGMGLFMVKTQVETMGGSITIASEVNSGSTFTTSFPLHTGNIGFEYVH